MLSGHYVYLPDGRHGQVLRIIDTAVNGAGGIPCPAVQYELAIDGERVYVGPIPHGRPIGWSRQRQLDALHTAPRLMPPCPSCGAAAGAPCEHAARVPAPVTA